jgi:hypothetical protein
MSSGNAARKERGMRTQKVVAEYLSRRGWPYAESTGSARQGCDVTGTPDIAVEVKARSDLNPLAWVRQARKGAQDGRLPFVVFRPNGMGETPEDYLVMLPFREMVDLLNAAGYGDTSRGAS